MTKEDTNICKAIAIFMMLVHHLFHAPGNYDTFTVIFAPLSSDKAVLLAEMCKICVSIFVFLTGYGYVRSKKQYDNKSDTLLCVKRYFRIMFGYWFIFIISQILSFLGRSRTDVYGGGETGVLYEIIDFLGLAKLFGTPTYNPTWWYLTYAIMFVFLTPLLIKAVKKNGLSVIVLSILIPRVLGFNADTGAFRYLLPLVSGIYIAEYDVFERISEKCNSICIAVVWLLYTTGVLVLRANTEWYGIFDGLAAVGICYMVYQWIGKVRFINKLLEYIGRHSMNIFMSHTLIYLYFFKEFIYSFKYSFLIFIALMLSSLLTSIVIEIIKKVLKYNILEKACIEKATSILNNIENKIA